MEISGRCKRMRPKSRHVEARLDRPPRRRLQEKVQYFSGNYHTYVKTPRDQDVAQMRCMMPNKAILPRSKTLSLGLVHQDSNCQSSNEKTDTPDTIAKEDMKFNRSWKGQNEA